MTDSSSILAKDPMEMSEDKYRLLIRSTEECMTAIEQYAPMLLPALSREVIEYWRWYRIDKLGREPDLFERLLLQNYNANTEVPKVGLKEDPDEEEPQELEAVVIVEDEAPVLDDLPRGDAQGGAGESPPRAQENTESSPQVRSSWEWPE